MFSVVSGLRAWYLQTFYKQIKYRNTHITKLYYKLLAMC